VPNLFEEILAHRSPALFVYRDKEVAAFMDIQPVNLRHVLVSPVKLARFLRDCVTILQKECLFWPSELLKR